MARGKRNVQVPGETSKDDPQVEAADPNPGADGTEASVVLGAAGAAPAAAADEPAAQANEPAAGTQADPVQDGPKVLRAADVDPTKLRRAVLTADGWVCPVDSPAPKAKE